MQNINMFVQAMESETWGQTSKSQKTENTLESPDLTASSSAIEVYQVPSLAIVPAVNFHRGAVAGAKEYNIDLSVEGMRRLVDFHVSGDCARIVPPSVLEKIFLDHYGQKQKKDAWKEIAVLFGFNRNNAQARSEGWIIDDFRKFTLENHPHGSVLDMLVRLVIRQVLSTLGKLSQTFCSTTLVLLVVAHIDPTYAKL
ncbi:hypothetical protein R1sor_004245 [Riccia sorocarpa]|uniref:MADF domain-containing protein n=1 Tax=Riccia sorocarpa TaxID=122646 RepID=A0ABD3H3Y6_9MARC